MADLTKTITNTVSMAGDEPVERWGTTFSWGDEWMFTDDIPVDVQKLIVNAAVAVSSMPEKNVSKLIETLQPSVSAVSKALAHVLSSELIPIHGASLSRHIEKMLANAQQVLSQNVGFDVTKLISESIASTVGIIRDLERAPIVESIAVGCDLSSEQLSDRAGYVRLFPGGVDNGERRISDRSTKDADPSTTFTPVADPTTVWS